MGSNGAVVALPRSASRIQRWRIPHLAEITVSPTDPDRCVVTCPQCGPLAKGATARVAEALRDDHITLRTKAA